MAHRPIPFIGPSYALDTGKADRQRVINMFPVANEVAGGKTGSYFQSVPGLDVFSAPYVPPPPHICTDGPEWSATVIGTANWHYSAYGTPDSDPTFIAIGQNAGTGNAVIAVSDDLGATWATPTDIGNFGGSAGQAAYGASLFLVALNAINYATSPDGVTWTTRTWPSAFPSGFVYGGGLFVVMANSGSVIRVSSDGLAWASATNPLSGDFTCIAYGAGRWVAIKDTQAVYSVDGVDWTAGTTTWTASSWQSIAYGAGVFVILDKSQTGTAVAKWSDDGDVWTGVNLPFDGSSTYDGLIYAQGRFFATKSNSTAFAISDDGKVWTLAAHTTPDAISRWGALNTDGNGHYIGLATFLNGTIKAMIGVC